MQDFEGNVLHEVAHGVQIDLFRRDPALEQNWIQLYDADQGYVSDYAKESWEEDFAESYRVYLTNPQALKTVDPAKYAFMRDYVFNPQYWP